MAQTQSNLGRIGLAIGTLIAILVGGFLLTRPRPPEKPLPLLSPAMQAPPAPLARVRPASAPPLEEHDHAHAAADAGN